MNPVDSEVSLVHGEYFADTFPLGNPDNRCVNKIHDLQQTGGGLGKTARRQRGSHRHARPAPAPRPYPQMWAAELEDQAAGGTMSPKTSRKATTSTMEDPEKMQPRSSK